MGFILAAALLFQAAGDAPKEPQKTTIQWNVVYGETFDMTWKYDEEIRLAVDAQKPMLTTDSRKVDAVLTCFKPGDGWRLDMTLKKLVWTVDSDDFTTEAVLDPKKNEEPQVKYVSKVRNKAAETNRHMNALRQSGFWGDHMLPRLQGKTCFALLKYRVGSFWKDGFPVQNTPSIFDRAYLHSSLPEGEVAVGQTWKEYMGAFPHESAPVELEDMSLKLVNIRNGNAVVRGTATKTADREILPGRRVKSSQSISREYVFSAEGYLLSSKEECASSREEENKDLKTGRPLPGRTNSFSSKQTLKLKKKVKPEDAKKQDNPPEAGPEPANEDKE